MSSLVLGLEFSPYYQSLSETRPSFEDEAYEALDAKYNISELTTRCGFVNYVFKEENVNEYCNYLLSLKDEKYRIFVWKYLYSLKDIELVGNLKKLYDKFKVDEEYYFNHNNDFFERNKSKSIKNEIVKIKPLTGRSAYSIYDAIDENEDNGGIDTFMYDIIWNNYWNYDEKNICFEIKNEKNKVVGVIGIAPEQKGLGYYKNTFSLFYYIMPKHRNKGYAKNAIKLLIELIKNKQIYREDLDPLYERKYVKNKIDINLINAYIKTNNVFSNKAMDSLNISKTGMFKTYTGEYFIDWNQYQITFD